MPQLRVLITGAANGIGRHLAFAFLARAHLVTALDSDAASLEKLPHIFSKQLSSSGKRNAVDANLLCIPADVADPAALDAAFQLHLSKFHGLDVLINNASPAPRDFGKGDPLVSLASFESSLQTGLFGPFVLSRLAAPHLSQSPHTGRIINIGSTRAHQSEPSGEGYAAAKGGLISLTHAMAISLSPKVLVNAISPGWIDVRHLQTRLLDDRNSEDGVYVEVDAIPEMEHRQQPVGRVGKPEDVEAWAVFLAEQETGFFQGQEIVLDGGMTKRMIYDEIPQH